MDRSDAESGSAVELPDAHLSLCGQLLQNGEGASNGLNGILGHGDSSS